MQELVPVVVGICIGFIVGGRPGRRSAAGAAASALALGALVAWVTGELAESLAFALLDGGVAVCALVLTVAAQRVYARAMRTEPTE